jgi:hypothetical protein
MGYAMVSVHRRCCRRRGGGDVDVERGDTGHGVQTAQVDGVRTQRSSLHEPKDVDASAVASNITLTGSAEGAATQPIAGHPTRQEAELSEAAAVAASVRAAL